MAALIASAALAVAATGCGDDPGSAGAVAEATEAAEAWTCTAPTPPGPC